ncbi:MAG: hypothetical protein AAGI08_15400 [Bacteroidota bacterium]
MQSPHQPLVPGQFYHVYNQGNNRENLFTSIEHFHRFLDTFKLYLGHYVDTFAFCLMGNHFHILIRIRDAESIHQAAHIDGMIAHDTTALPAPEALVSERFRRFYISYAKYFNLKQCRKGSLFLKNFRRELVGTEPYLLYLVYYILSNPKKHGFVDDFRTYQFSSLTDTFGSAPTWIARDELLDWFGGVDGLKTFLHSCETTRAGRLFSPPDEDEIVS